MSKLLKLISVALLGIVLSSGAFAKTEVVYIPKNTGNPYFDSIIKGFEVGAEKYGYNFSTVAPATADATSQLPFIKAEIQRGVDVIAMNKDLTFPINDHEFKDGNGAIVREIENLVGSSINSFL